MRSDTFTVKRWDDDHHGADLRSVAAVTAHDAKNGGLMMLGHLNSAHKIGGDVLLQIPAPDRKHEEGILVIESRSFEPLRECCIPPLIICASCQFRYVVRRCIRFEAAKLAKIVYGMPRVSSRPANAQNE